MTTIDNKQRLVQKVGDTHLDIGVGGEVRKNPRMVMEREKRSS
jgi:hypothetical protein